MIRFTSEGRGTSGDELLDDRAGVRAGDVTGDRTEDWASDGVEDSAGDGTGALADVRDGDSGDVPMFTVIREGGGAVERGNRAAALALTGVGHARDCEDGFIGAGSCDDIGPDSP